MKKVCLVLILFFAFGFMSQASAQSATPEKVIKDFYSFYIKAIDKNDFPLTSKPAKMKQYISTRFYSETRRIYDRNEFDADYFISAQDWDKAWSQNITVSKVVKTKSKATANVLLKGKNFDQKLKVMLVLEKGAWKIDNVEQR